MSLFSDPLIRFKMQIDSVKRCDYIKWNEYYMAIVQLTAERCLQEPKLASILVNDLYMIVGMAHHTLNEHSEIGAINMSKGNTNLDNLQMFCLEPPCENCAHEIVANGVKTVYYLHRTDPGISCYNQIEAIFQKGCVEFRQTTASIGEIVLDFNS